MKKILAIVLALSLAISLCAVFTSAADEVKIKEITFESAKKDVVTCNPRKDAKIDVLIDGDTLSAEGKVPTGFDTKGIVLFGNTLCTTAGEYPEFSLTLELEKAANIAGITVSLYEEYNSMIGTPKDGKVSVLSSNDGKDFQLVDDYDLGCSDANADWAANKKEIKVEDCEVNFDKVVNAKYIRLTFAYGECPEGFADSKVIWEWLGITEVGVKAGAAATVPSEDESSAESTAESTAESSTAATSSTASEDKTTDTSDSGIAALAVISVLALVGVVVVKKSR